MRKKMNLEQMLEERIVTLYAKLDTLEQGTKEYDSVVDDLTKLTNLKNEVNKTKVNNWSQLFKVAADVGLGVASLLVLIWGTNKNIKFEETGTYTTGIGRKFQDKLMNLFRR